MTGATYNNGKLPNRRWKNRNVILLIVILGIGGLLAWQKILRHDFRLPRGGQSKTETLVIKGNDVVGTNPAQKPLTEKTDMASEFETKEITITDGVKHSVPLDEIIGGGPPKDGIPSIDQPKFVAVPAADFLTDAEPGLALDLDGVARFYPFQILVWHEIVNDTINGKRILITYCPLCLSGIVFDPVVKGERVLFGTSGKLWNSNLVMYDRKTDSLWSQILGEAIVGEMTGTKLTVHPSDQIRFGDFKKKYPRGEVLSRDTGATRFYGQDPYGDYYTKPGTYFSLSHKDNRLGEKEFVLGIVVNGKAKAYWPAAVKNVGTLEDKFQGKTIVVKYDSEIDAVRLFEKKPDGTQTRLNPFGSFWFAWAAAHPDTELYK